MDGNELRRARRDQAPIARLQCKPVAAAGLGSYPDFWDRHRDMKVVCAWCKTVIRDDPGAGAPVSHGMCRECGYTYLHQQGIGLRNMIAQLAVPVLVMDHDAVLLAANPAAGALLRQAPEQLAGQRGGTVIACANASTPGGCGHSAHCDGCRLRAAISATHADGLPRYGIVSEHPLDPGTGDERLWLRFSTTRVSDAVVLMIEGTEIVRRQP